MKIRLETVQLVTGLSFGGTHTASLHDSVAEQLEYDSEDELVFAKSKKPGSKTLLIPETNVLYMVAYVEPTPKAEAPKPAPAPSQVKDDTIRAVAPGKTERSK